MHHTYNFTAGINGFGIIGRIAVALAILLVLKQFDKNNKEYDKGLKTLLFGVVATVALLAVALGIFRGMAFFTPLKYFW